MKLPPLDMTAPFSEQVNAVLTLAYEEAVRLGNSHVAVEHLLLALVRVEDEGRALLKRVTSRRWGSPTGQILRDYDVHPRRVEEVIRRQNVGFVHRYGDNAASLDFSADARHALRLANYEMHWGDLSVIDAPQLLMGIMLQPKGCAVARTLRMDLKKVRERLRQSVATPQPSLLRTRHRSRYTPSAQIALSLAQTEAKALHHSDLGTEHLLLGLVRERNGAASRVLKNLGVEAAALFSRIEQLRPPEAESEIMGLSTSYKRLLDRAGDEMRGRNHALIGTGHLLFHLVRFTDDVSARALRRLTIKAQDVYDQMAQYLSLSPAVFDGVEAEFENPLLDFTPAAQSVLQATLEEAERLEHHVVDTGHLLMGLLMAEDGAINSLVQMPEFNRRRVRGLLELMTARDYQFGLKPMRLSDDLQAVLAIAAKHACDGCEYPKIAPPHLLLALFSQPESGVAQILEQLSLNRETLYQDVLARLLIIR